MYNLKKFENTNQRTENRITITKSMSFGFPTKFYQDNKLDEYKYVVIYYDKEQGVVAFNFNNNQEEKHKFTMMKSTKGYGAGIVATSFFKTNNLDPAIYHGKYDWEKTNMEGVGELFVIKLKEKIQPLPANQSNVG